MGTESRTYHHLLRSDHSFTIRCHQILNRSQKSAQTKKSLSAISNQLTYRHNMILFKKTQNGTNSCTSVLYYRSLHFERLRSYSLESQTKDSLYSQRRDLNSGPRPQIVWLNQIWSSLFFHETFEHFRLLRHSERIHL